MITRNKKITYVSGPYSNGGTQPQDREKNLKIANKHAVKLWNMGYAVICPHSNTAWYDDNEKIKIGFKEFIEGDLAFLNYVDCIFMLPNWDLSKGAKIEHAHAADIDLPIFYSLVKIKKFLKSTKRCNCCGLFRLKYATFGDLVYCNTCNDSIERYSAYQNKSFLLVPRQ